MQDELFADEAQDLRALLARLPQQGVLQWIGVRGHRLAAVPSVARVEALSAGTLAGDHARAGARAVTLIQAEHLRVVAALLARGDVAPELVRRNLVVAGINLFALRRARFAIGEVVFEGSGTCDPCSRMEAALGPGGFNAMRGHGGITARIVQGGTLRVGDAVRLIEVLAVSAAR